eukprot:TRINITY_DN19474_c0_g1::TRINITY_DN19474_c0_g1_i1::g.17105::m.17105 TRINITY_DN19474_c0_g1::TRINITY_DN19474_c0_g1_i1::g.17105  ORF type:complete len:117 (-),score=-7.91,Integrin_alpha2/PF08441.7/0.18 TRINITY_DN19474_c0_g1_i1:39-389(-)
MLENDLRNDSGRISKILPQHSDHPCGNASRSSLMILRLTLEHAMMSGVSLQLSLSFTTASLSESGRADKSISTISGALDAQAWCSAVRPDLSLCRIGSELGNRGKCKASMDERADS